MIIEIGGKFWFQDRFSVEGWLQSVTKLAIPSVLQVCCLRLIMGALSDFNIQENVYYSILLLVAL